MSLMGSLALVGVPLDPDMRAPRARDFLELAQRILTRFSGDATAICAAIRGGMGGASKGCVGGSWASAGPGAGAGRGDDVDVAVRIADRLAGLEQASLRQCKDPLLLYPISLDILHDHLSLSHGYSPIHSIICMPLWLPTADILKQQHQPLTYPFLFSSSHSLALSRCDLRPPSLRIGLQAGRVFRWPAVRRRHRGRPGLCPLRGLLPARGGEACRGQSLPRDAASSIVVVFVVADHSTTTTCPWQYYQHLQRQYHQLH